MPENYTINVLSRTDANTGKNAMRRLRNQGLIPAVVYGCDKPNQNLSLDPRIITTAMENKSFYAQVHDLIIDAETAKLTDKAIVKSVQFHPVTDKPIHIDFLRVNDDTIVKVDVPVLLANRETCRGLKVGGVLNIVRSKIGIICAAKDIPQELVIDIKDIGIGKAIKTNLINLPDNVSFQITDRDVTLATIATPRGVSVTDDEETSEDNNQED
jgi:large subunit ribosomal protein L25